MYSAVFSPSSPSPPPHHPPSKTLRVRLHMRQSSETFRNAVPLLARLRCPCLVSCSQHPLAPLRHHTCTTPVPPAPPPSLASSALVTPQKPPECRVSQHQTVHQQGLSRLVRLSPPTKSLQEVPRRPGFTSGSSGSPTFPFPAPPPGRHSYPLGTAPLFCYYWGSVLVHRDMGIDPGLPLSFAHARPLRQAPLHYFNCVGARMLCRRLGPFFLPLFSSNQPRRPLSG